MRTLMQDVAARAGVSVTTVSHVLNRTRPVAQATAERVLCAARELSYYTNASARLLARGSSNTLGLIISDIENPFFAELIKSFELESLAQGREILLSTTSYDPSQAHKAVRRMLESKVGGVAVMTSQLGPELINELVASGTPVVLLDGGAAGPYRSSAKVDYLPGATQAVRHLAELGHRRFGFIAGPSHRVSALTYRDAVVSVIVQAGLPGPAVLETTNTPESGASAVRAWLSKGRLPSAILCGNDLCAFGAMGAIFEAGLRVPADVSVVGADDIAFARFSHPPLTTVRLPRDVLGRAAFDALQRLLKSKRHAGRVYPIETKLVVRQSTGLAPRAKRQSKQSGDQPWQTEK
jgi:DNA-binding LacI/PurR family transcriptional regulator